MINKEINEVNFGTQRVVELPSKTSNNLLSVHTILNFQE